MKSKWDCVYQKIEEHPPLTLQPQTSYKDLMQLLSYYKFAAKMVGSGKRVLDLGCKEGLGSWLLAKECGYCLGIDEYNHIERAKRNFQSEQIDFACQIEGRWDAIVALNEDWEKSYLTFLKEDGIVVTTLPKAHSINEFQEIFKTIFVFGANEELVHTGLSFAHHIIVLACGVKK